MIEYKEKELKKERKCLHCHRILTNKGSIICPCCTRSGVKIGIAVLAGVGVIAAALGKNLRRDIERW